MMVKLLELRDEGTFIPLLAVDMNPGVYRDDGPGMSAEYEAQRYLLRRCGYPCDGRPNVAITRLDCDGGPCTNDPYHWGESRRTYFVAHNWIIDHWRDLKDGDVVDVQFILGETSAPKVSERVSL
jgi:hypothetical protein